MRRYRIEVGHNHKVQPGNIVGAIANEAGLESQYIGRINIYDDYSTIDLPDGMPSEIFKDLKKTRVAGQALRISAEGETQKKPAKHRKKSEDTGKPAAKNAKPRHKPAPKRDKKKPPKKVKAK
jgi:ATP-dependent RNA helicase DeaD